MNAITTLQSIRESADNMLSYASADGEYQHAFNMRADKEKLAQAFAILADMEEAINVEILAAWRAESIQVIKS